MIEQNFIQESFHSILSKLKSGARARVELNKEQVEILTKCWNLYLESNNFNDLKKVFCILEHSTTTSKSFWPLYFESLKKLKEPESIIHCLGSAQTQIMSHCNKKGERVPFEYIECLKDLLESNNSECLEWVLRSIEGLGPQSIILRQEVLQSRPHRLRTWFDPHAKNVRSLVDFLENRWRQRPQL